MAGKAVIKKTGIVFLILLSAFPAMARNPFDWARIRLDYARKEKVAQLQQFCDRIHALACQAAGDATVNGFFDINRRYAEAMEKGDAPSELIEKVEELRLKFNHYYIRHFFAFHDMLFVDIQGNIFYSMRRESELQDNLLAENSDGSALRTAMKELPRQESFVDFHIYEPSAEAAAFFIEPMLTDSEHTGWLILQCAVNKVNSIFAWNEDLGQTGETFLVNSDGYMLTESNFEGESTILTRRLDDRNIKAKFADGDGHRTVTDYRNQTALSSFEVVDFMQTLWLVVAKMDRDEIITSHYTSHPRYYGDRLLARIRNGVEPGTEGSDTCPAGALLKVDMDEYLKAKNGECLQTFGVSTCTGLIAAFPGKFGYMAHISPKDRVYGAGDTNLLGQMLKRITTFDIYPAEKNRVQFFITAPHLESLLNITSTLIEKGFFLSQIHALYNPDARSAAITYNFLNNNLHVSWSLQDSAVGEITQSLDDALNLGMLIEAIMEEEIQHSQPS